MVRPIDVQQVILQSSAIEKVQQVQQRHSGIQQEYLDLQLKEEKNIRREKVQDASEAEKSEIRDRENDKKKQSAKHRIGKSKENDDEKLDAEEDMKSEAMGRFIDIKV